MAHHAYFVAGDLEEGISAARVFAERELSLSGTGNPDITVVRYGLLSVDDARRLRTLAALSAAGSSKALIISAGRLFHQAQNALLKLFEEPPAHTFLFLVIPAEGLLLPTLRSRLVPLPREKEPVPTPLAPEVTQFIAASAAEREKMVAKLIDRSKSDNDEEKQRARLAALRLAEGLAIVAHAQFQEESSEAKRTPLYEFLNDLYRFIPFLHERSAPLKLIYEHLLLTVPLLRVRENRY